MYAEACLTLENRYGGCFHVALCSTDAAGKPGIILISKSCGQNKSAAGLKYCYEVIKQRNHPRKVVSIL